ncbi:MAG TPA: CDP-diacylglycerol diphosphatase [Thermodesulfovibrionales bacterium]|nr:CDP-diacylglycerol diphosphatase [Thermodesulfovibrionales bacterium]
MSVDNQHKVFRILALISALLIFATLLSACVNRDILWNIVTNCLDSTVSDYDKRCRWPIDNSVAACRNSTGLWDENAEFVVLRDEKMCDCLDNKTFVHGLAIPRTKVTGTEDPKRPISIWQFAWDYAVKRIRNKKEIALVVNPPGKNRSQDQLHVHIVRLNDAGRRLIASPNVSNVKSLADIWNKADTLAKEKGFDYYGVLVAKNPAGGFIVFVNNRNLEYDYTLAKCPTAGLFSDTP